MQRRAMAEGIRTRHLRRCAANAGSTCTCTPSYEASVYSAADEKKIRRSFPTLAAARAWRRDAGRAVVAQRLRGPAGVTVAEAARELIDGMIAGLIRTRSGDLYKPATIRS